MEQDIADNALVYSWTVGLLADVDYMYMVTATEYHLTWCLVVKRWWFSNHPGLWLIAENWLRRHLDTPNSLAGDGKLTTVLTRSTGSWEVSWWVVSRVTWHVSNSLGMPSPELIYHIVLRQVYVLASDNVAFVLRSVFSLTSFWQLVMLYMHLLLLYNQSVNHTLNVAHKQQTATTRTFASWVCCVQ